MQKSYLGRLLAATALAGTLAACAADPLVDPIRSGVPVGSESTGFGKTESVVRVAAATAARGDDSMAASLYRRAHSLDPGNFDAAMGLATALTRLGARDDAAQAYRDAIFIRPDDSEALRGLGNVLILLNEPATAAQQFNRALQKGKDPRLLNGLGVAHDMLDDRAAAQAFYREGLELAPDHVELANNLGLSLLLSGDTFQAITMLRRAAGTKGATVRQRLNLALALIMFGDTPAAEQIVRIDLDPASANAQIAYFETVAAMRDPRALRRAVGAHLTGAPAGS